MYKNIKTFNKLWEKKVITKPIVIVYGGYAGTGKSTTCKRLSELIKYSTNLPTGVIRSSITEYLKNIDPELVSSHTYSLHKIKNKLDPSKEENKYEIIQRFREQIDPISKAINNVISFAASEKQHILIDGNHVFPGFIKDNPNVYLIEFYNKVSDPKQHYEMLSGPTHNRTLDEEEFMTARILHDYTVEQCNKNNKATFEYNIAKKEAEKKLNQIIGDIIKEYI